jgi:DNA-binding transcriptional ArsR family regulator
MTDAPVTLALPIAQRAAALAFYRDALGLEPFGEPGSDGIPEPLQFAVNDLVAELGLAQPQVSKHLRVLREVGAVDVRDEGRRRLYRVNGEALKPIHDWVSGFERLWTKRFDRLDGVLEDLKREEQGDGAGDE